MSRDTARQLLALLSFLMPRVFKTETIDVLLQVLQRGMKANDGKYYHVLRNCHC
jgi:hypothetical protein